MEDQDGIHKRILDLDLKELSNKTKNEIIIVSQSLGIPVRTTNTKQVLLSLLFNFIREYKENIEKQRDNDINGSTNRSLYELPIKEGILKTEKLFWRIFKDRVLFKELTKHLNNGITLSKTLDNFGFGKLFYKYNEINSIQWMIKNKHCSLLIEKIKNGENQFVGGDYFNQDYMDSNFATTLNINSKKDKNYEPLEKVKVSYIFQDCIRYVHTQDQDFFQKLIKNYSRYLICMDSLLEYSIIHHNLSAYIVLIEKRKQATTTNTNNQLFYNDVFKLVKNQFYKGLEWYIGNIKSLGINGHQLELNNILTTTENKSIRYPGKLLKIILFLIDSKYLSISSTLKSKYIEIILNICKSTGNGGSGNGENSLNWLNFKVCHLIYFYRLISILYYQYSFQHSKIINDSFIGQFNLEISKFTKEQLKCKVKSILKNQPFPNYYLKIKQQKETSSIIQYDEPTLKDCSISTIKKMVDEYIESSNNFNDCIKIFNLQGNDYNGIESCLLKAIKPTTTTTSSTSTKTTTKIKKQQQQQLISYKSKINYLIISLKFGIYEYWKQFATDKIKSNIFTDFFTFDENGVYKCKNILFKYCKNDKNRQIEFINQISEFIVSNGNAGNIGGLDSKKQTNLKTIKDLFVSYSYTLLYLVIANDDTQLISLVISKLVKFIDFKASSTINATPPPQSIGKSFYIQNFIQSVSTLEYCYDTLTCHFFNDKSWFNNFFFRFNNMELFTRFESLLSNSPPPTDIIPSPQNIAINFKLLDIQIFKNDIISFSKLLKMFKHVITSKYNYESDVLYNCIGYLNTLVIDEQSFNESILPDIQFIIENSNIRFNPIQIFKNHYQIVRFLNWIKLNNSKFIDSNDAGTTTTSRCCFNFNKVNNNPILIGSNGDIETLSIYVNGYISLCNQLPKNSNNESSIESAGYSSFSNNILEIITQAATFGRLEIFQYLYLNHSKLLIKSNLNKDNNGLFNYVDLRGVMIAAIKNGHLQIMDFMVTIIGCSINKCDAFKYLNIYPKFESNLNQNNNLIEPKRKRNYDDDNNNI